MRFAAVVLAAGRGVRLGEAAGGRPKGLAPLAGRPLLRWSCEALAAHPACAGVVAVAPTGLLDEARVALDGLGADVVGGGARRQDSARLGLEAAAALLATAACDLVHDAARPFVPPTLIDRLLAALEGGADAAVPGTVPAETVKRVDGAGRVLETPPRAALRAVGTPQALRRPRGLEAFRRRADLADFTDDAAVVEADGGTVRVVEGDPLAFKVTTPADLARAEAIARAAAAMGG